MPPCLLSGWRGQARAGLAGREQVQTQEAELGVSTSYAQVLPSVLSSLQSAQLACISWGGVSSAELAGERSRSPWEPNTKSPLAWLGRQQWSENRQMSELQLGVKGTGDAPKATSPDPHHPSSHCMGTPLGTKLVIHLQALTLAGLGHWLPLQQAAAPCTLEGCDFFL